MTGVSDAELSRSGGVESDRADRLTRVTSLLRNVSATTDPQQIQTYFGEELRRLFPIHGYMSISTRGLGEGEYKVTGMSTGEGPLRRRDPWAHWDEIPLRRGGVIGRVIEGEVPVMLHDVDLSGDPVLGEELGDRRSLIAVPLYEEGRAVNWAMILHKDPTAFEYADLEQFFIRGNLIGRMTKNLVDQRRLHELLKQQEDELQRIAMIQQALLPARTPTPAGLSIATSYLTSQESGGDFYDFYEWEDGRFGVLIADVAGHGAGAAVVVAMLQAILHTMPRDRMHLPSDVLAYLNEHLSRKRIENSFVTAFAAVFSADRTKLDYANAGHNRPVLRRGPAGDGTVTTIDGAASVPLGILKDGSYTAGAIDLEPGDTIALYTDGIVEAFAKGDEGEPMGKREMFGTGRLQESLVDCTGAPQCTIGSVHQKLYEYTGSRTRKDDQTIVAIQVDRELSGLTAVEDAVGGRAVAG